MTTRQSTTRKSATRKPTTAKKTTRKKAPRKTARKKARRITASKLLGTELPKSLKTLSQQLRRDLIRVMRDASHHLGTLEARGQQEWRKMSSRARNEVARTLERVKRAARRR